MPMLRRRRRPSAFFVRALRAQLRLQCRRLRRGRPAVDPEAVPCCIAARCNAPCYVRYMEESVGIGKVSGGGGSTAFQPGRVRRRWLLVGVLMAVFALHSCRADVIDVSVSGVGESSQSSVVVSQSTTGLSVSESPVSTPTNLVTEYLSAYKPVVMERPPVSYLREVVPPCLPVESGRDPCRGASGLLGSAGGSSGQRAWSLGGIPSFDDVMLGRTSLDTIASVFIPHIVIRGAVQADTTRCELYPFRRYAYDDIFWYGDHYYYCFADVSVHEYIVGEGPAELTIGMHRELALFTIEQLEYWTNIRDEWIVGMVEWLQDPQRRAKLFYEGKELVLLLVTSPTIALESWVVSGWWGTVWFLQRNDNGEVRALEQDHALATPEERNRFDLALSELVERIKEAAENRPAVTGWRIGEDPNLPLLVTDANRLQDFYRAAGAVYEGDGATVLPPPIPGG